MSPLLRTRLILLAMGAFALAPLLWALARGFGSPATRTLIVAVLAGLAVAAVISIVRGRQRR